MARVRLTVLGIESWQGQVRAEPRDTRAASLHGDVWVIEENFSPEKNDGHLLRRISLGTVLRIQCGAGLGGSQRGNRGTS